MQRCEICHIETEKLFTCKICGRKVCEEDFDKKRGICIACSETLCTICGKYLSIAICNICGRLICEDCSIKNGAGYICVKCAERLEYENKA